MLPLDLAHVDRRFLSWLCLEMFLGVCEVLSTASANAVLYNLKHRLSSLIFGHGTLP